MKYYNFNIGDYRKDTDHLSHEEHYIYRTLLDTAYESEASLSLDKRLLMRRLGLTTDQADLLDNVLSDFFVETEKGYNHPRVQEELGIIYEKSTKARESAEARWKKHANASDNDANAMRTHSDGNATGMLTQDPRPTNPKKRQTFSEQDMRLARFFFSLIQKNNPKAKEPNFKQWAKAIRLIRTQDNKTAEGIQGLFKWATQHDFWHQQILSPTKLRKQWDTLWTQRKAESNGGGRKLRLPADDDALNVFAQIHKLPKAQSGESYWQYRNRLNSAIDNREH